MSLHASTEAQRNERNIEMADMQHSMLLRRYTETLWDRVFVIVVLEEYALRGVDLRCDITQ